MDDIEKATALAVAEREREMIRGRIVDMVKASHALEIVDDETRQGAADFLGEAKAVEKVIADTRAEIVKPLKLAQTRINKLFAEPLEQIGDAITRAKAKVQGHYLKERHAGREPNKTFRGMDGGTVTLRRQRGFTITDSSKVPRAYMMVDDKAIRRAIKASDGEVNIEGVEVHKGDVTVSVRV